MDDWETLGAVDPRQLIDVRRQIHWAAQAASAVGKQLLPPRPDVSQQSFEWQAHPRGLAQGLVAGERPFRSALRLSPPALRLLDGDGAVLRELPLEGRTLEEAYAWVKEEAERLLGRPLKELERPEGVPAHPVSEGAPFSFPDPAPAAELERYFAGADRLFRWVRDREPKASPVLCWPHHFDVATLIALELIPLDPGAEAETARSIGVGMSPGDEGRPAPYFYVLPWPRPEGKGLPPLDGGHWNTEGWTGAVLDAADFAGVGGDQRKRIERFLGSAISACRSLLE
ncbi:MAG: hypothetical protein ACJ75H_09990 [Thermoanaerobaculia bacterium]